MGSCGMKFFDDFCDSVANSRDFTQSILGDHLIQREAQRQQIVCGPGVRFCPERVALTQGAVPAEFSEQGSDGAGIERGHIRDAKRDARRSMHLGNGPGKMLVALLSGVPTIWLAPKVRQRTVFAVDGILARACGSRNCGKRLRAVV